MLFAFCLIAAGGLLALTGLIAIGLTRNALHSAARSRSATHSITIGVLSMVAPAGRAGSREPRL
jgi:hypothetical protein